MDHEDSPAAWEHLRIAAFGVIALDPVTLAHRNLSRSHVNLGEFSRNSSKSQA